MKKAFVSVLMAGWTGVVGLGLGTTGQRNLSAQQGTQPLGVPDFEAVSVKPVPEDQALDQRRAQGFSQWGPGTADPGQIRFIGNTLLQLLMAAYTVPADQVIGPAWISSPQYRYDIDARLPIGTKKESLSLMLRKVITERFQISFHKERRDFVAYELSVGPKSAKLRPTAYPDAKPSYGQKEVDRDGCPRFPAGTGGMAAHRVNGSLWCRTYVSVSIADFIRNLSIEISNGNMIAPARIADRTGLPGKYDFTLVATMAPPTAAMQQAMMTPIGEQPGGSDDLGLPIETAIQQQLGLVLRRTKVSLEAVVVDQANKMPLPN
jgi:uncharacterized protein (TIGR03435 family)